LKSFFSRGFLYNKIARLTAKHSNILRRSFKDKFPRLFELAAVFYFFILRLFYHKSRTYIVFNKIYRNNNWGDSYSVSGPGSNLKNTENLRKELPLVLRELGIKSFLDIPCGDYFWMKEITLSVNLYIGADLVDELVTKNRNLYGNEKSKFIQLDLTRDELPEVDAIFCRDCLPHLSLRLIKAAVRSVKKSNSKYFFTSTYISCKENKNVFIGGFRPINLQLIPFNFPQPLKVIQDTCITENEILKDKSIGVWRIESIPTI
jgi:SAM-dependent methyltransferase